MKKTLKRIFAAAIGALVLSTNVCGATLSGEQEYTFIHDLVDFIEANAKFPKDKNTLLDIALHARLTNPEAGFNGMVEAVMDIRYPVLFHLEEAVKLIKMRLPRMEITVPSWRKPHHVSEHTELVQELLEAYHEVTGGEKRTIAIGGGTYAQSMEEGVAFGASFPGEEELAHQANEYIKEEVLFQNARIFARAIIRLAGVKE